MNPFFKIFSVLIIYLLIPQLLHAFDNSNGVKKLYSVHKRIHNGVHGENLNHIVSIRSNNKPELTFCSGTLISDKYVLTVAHCFDGMGSHSEVESFVVHSTHSQNTNNSKIEKIMNHEGYSSLLKANDISIIKIKDPLIVQGEYPKIYPSMIHEGFNLLVVGMGIESDTNDGKHTPSNPVYIEVSYSDRQKCKNSDCETCLCYTIKDGMGLCNGDSGGPVVSKDLYMNPIIGISSFTLGFDGVYPCGRTGNVDFFTRAAIYLDWISEKTNIPKNMLTYD
ncbi:Mite allergen Eur m 3 [Smittium mucronatum]|uniref:Mite allergen Eur m 3 n=1 Tax=Smittium mucronatum TaxID=133383 RepID=A0A1R0GTI9_9FUNG|nr:Mite allergen Eur m 3 [Smittium mucronatum]